MCHGIPRHVVEQSMSLTVIKTNVQYQVRLFNHGTLGHDVAQWATILNNGIPIDIKVNNNDHQSNLNFSL